jgi:hypothetical protein
VTYPDFSIGEPGFARPGDIGALVVTVDTCEAVGMIADVDDKEGHTLCMAMQPVLDRLGVDLVQRPTRYVRTQQTTEKIDAIRDMVGGEDKLGFTHYVNAFVRLIKDTQPPLTIGIYGAWGTGKSFLMDKIAKKLSSKDDVKQIEKLPLWRKVLRKADERDPVIWFEAWDYNSSDKLWAGLVERIFLGIENSGLGWYEQLRINVRRNLERHWRRWRAKIFPYTLIAIVTAGLMVGFALANLKDWATVFGGSTLLVILLSLGRLLADVLSTPASQRIVDLFANADYKSDFGFMGRIKQDLESFANSLPPQMKVVVFIDDLDRCDPKKAVEVLEAVKLLLDFDRFIVFLALDARIITHAIEDHYGKVLVEAEITGYEYLDKIVQIPFSIPESPASEFRKYLGSLVGMSETEIPQIPIPTVAKRESKVEVKEPEFVAEPAKQPLTIEGGDGEQQEEAAPIDIPSDPPAAPATLISELEQAFDTYEVAFTPAEQQAFLAFYSDLAPNPRRIKRLVNIYRLVRSLIAGRRHEQLTAGMAASEALPDNPRHILGWIIVCEQWPYAAHTMMEILDQSIKRTEVDPEALRELLDRDLMELYDAAKLRIAQQGDEPLKRLDLKHEQLHTFLKTQVSDLKLADIERLRLFTVNFNPALSSEVRLTLSNEGN